MKIEKSRFVGVFLFLLLIGGSQCPSYAHEGVICPPPDSTSSVAELGVVIAGNGDGGERGCAARDLAARGATAVPVAIGLLRSRDHFVRGTALGVIHDLGPQAAAALPLLMHELRSMPLGMRGNYESLHSLYYAVGGLAQAATPAIPLLISKSSETKHRAFAVETLGIVGKYDPARVVPHLLEMLKKGEDARMVLDALGVMGKYANTAIPTLLTMLEHAKIQRESVNGDAVVRTLAAIAEPAQSVPILTSLLSHPSLKTSAVKSLEAMGPSATNAVPGLINTLKRGDDWYMSNALVGALVAIAPASSAVRQQLLIEATQHQNKRAARELSRMGPLPRQFASALTAALAKKPDDVDLRQALKNATGPKPQR